MKLPHPHAEQVFCGYHRASKAVDACGRCGRFMCTRCLESHPSLCPLCLQQRRHVVGGEGEERLGALLSSSWEVFCVHWLRLSLASLAATTGPALVLVALLLPKVRSCATNNLSPLEAFSPGFIVVPLGIYILLSGFMLGGLVRMSQEALEGQTPLWASMLQLKPALKSALAFALLLLPVCIPLLGAYFLSRMGGPWSGGMALLLGLGAAMAAYIWLLPCVFLMQVLAEEEEVGLVEAFRRCMAAGSGRRLKIFLGLLIMWLVQQVASLCGLLWAPAFALSILFQCALWNSLSAHPPSRSL